MQYNVHRKVKLRQVSGMNDKKNHPTRRTNALPAMQRHGARLILMAGATFATLVGSQTLAALDLARVNADSAVVANDVSAQSSTLEAMAKPTTTDQVKIWITPQASVPPTNTPVPTATLEPIDANSMPTTTDQVKIWITPQATIQPSNTPVPTATAVPLTPTAVVQSGNTVTIPIAPAALQVQPTAAVQVQPAPVQPRPRTRSS